MSGKIIGLLAMNVSLEVGKQVGQLADKVKPNLETILVAVQILVGLATAYYFWRRARSVKKDDE